MNKKQAGEPEKLLVCGTSVRGDRKYQQDAYYYHYLEEGIGAVICDGMGGIAGGERASEAAVEIYRELLDELTIEEIPDFHKNIACRMDETICNLTDEKGDQLGAGSTAVTVYIKNRQLFWMSVGDSRIYLIRDHEILPVVRPHNYGRLLDEALKKGEISNEEYGKKDKKREALTSYLGMEGIRFLDYNREAFPLQEEDIVLLCSDGLYKALSDEQIMQIIADCGENFLMLSDELTEAAETYGERPLDNCTVIVIKYTEDGGMEDGSKKM